MSKLTILRGVSGSGKSTWARQQNALVVSRDDLRKLVYGSDDKDYYAVDSELLRSREEAITVYQNGLIAQGLKMGKDVIVDNTNTEWKFVKQIAKIGYRYGAEVEVKVFDVDYNTAVLRDEFRAAAGGRSVGRDVIGKQYDRLSKTKNLKLEPVRDVKPYTGTPGKPDAFMFDLDGTIYHMNDKRGPYAHNVDVDDPDEVVQEIVRRLEDSGLVAIAMSGRKEATRETTEKCLERDDVPYHELFMRADDDNRADNLVKADLFDENVRDNYNVLFVLDDRDQVVEMWRRMGLTCLQVAPGDF